MSKIDLVKHHIDVENELDRDAMIETLSDDHPVRDEVAGKRYEGLEQVAGRYDDLWIAFPDFHVTPTSFHETDDVVVMEAEFSGTQKGVFNGLPPNNKAFNIRLVNVFRFKGDKILSETIYLDYTTQLQQLGHVPADLPQELVEG